MIAHLLDRSVQVWRQVVVPDGSGGQTITRALAGTVAAKVDQPSVDERQVAATAGMEHTHNVYLLPGTDVVRGDELVGDGDTLRVVSVHHPSRAVYLRAECEQIQAEGG